ncbi:MAG: FAD-dependent oxidoreductase [Mycobacterium sp.]
MPRIGEHAVVLGASMSGLLAARVLADFYGTVTMVERDVLPETAVNRRGASQGRHAHALLGRGSQILDDLFPGFLNELVAAGAPVIDGSDLSEVLFCTGGHQLVRSGRFNDLPPAFAPSRALLECLVRRRVRAIGKITMLEGHDVVELTSTTTRDRVTGARVRAHDSDSERVLVADLVVDATGRGARTPAFLDSLGYGRPAEDRVGVRVAYSSQLLRLPPGQLKEVFVLVGAVAGRPTGMALLAHENDTWMLTLAGMVGREPPVARTEMLEFAKEFTPAHVLAAIRAAEPLEEVCRYRYPASQWRRYDKMRRFPAGLLVVGDAICSLNPVYGQGMTVAALQALALDRCLRRGGNGLARRYFRAAAKPIGVAWQLGAGVDLNLPGVERRRPLSMRITNWYVDRVLTACESDPMVAGRFIKVTGLIDAPTRLLRPSTMWRVALAKRRRHRANRPAEDQAGSMTREAEPRV